MFNNTYFHVCMYVYMGGMYCMDHEELLTFNTIEYENHDYFNGLGSSVS
jgi:hypothetical protein